MPHRQTCDPRVQFFYLFVRESWQGCALGRDILDQVRYSTSVRGDPCLTCLLDQYNRHRRVDDAEGASNAGRTTGSIRVIPQAASWNLCASESQQCYLKSVPEPLHEAGRVGMPATGSFCSTYPVGTLSRLVAFGFLAALRCRDRVLDEL